MNLWPRRQCPTAHARPRPTPRARLARWLWLVAGLVALGGCQADAVTHQFGELAFDAPTAWRVEQRDDALLELRLQNAAGQDTASLLLRLGQRGQSLEALIEAAARQAEAAADVVRSAPLRHGEQGGRTLSLPLVIRQGEAHALSLLTAREVAGQPLLAVLSTADQASLDATMDAFNAIMLSLRARDQHLAGEAEPAADAGRCRTVLQARFVPSYGGCVGAYCTPSWGGSYVNVPQRLCD